MSARAITVYLLERGAEPRYASLTGWTSEADKACHFVTAAAAAGAAIGMYAGARVTTHVFDFHEDE